MADFEVPTNHKTRTDSQKNRHFLVRSFLARFAKESVGGRIEFKDIQKGINAFLAKSASEHIGRIELSRCLKLLKVPVSYYHGAYIDGYEWVDKKPTRKVTFRVDPTDYLRRWKEERTFYDVGMCMATTRAYKAFCNWCGDEGYAKCTIQMFVKKMNWILDPENGKPYTTSKYTYTFWEDYVLVFDHDNLNVPDPETGVLLRTRAMKNMTERQWYQTREKRGYYVRKDW